MKKLLTIIFAVTISVAGFCQQTVKGTITDSKGDLVVGAVVINEGLSATTISDVDGNFEIRADEGQTLLFSCLGLDDTSVTVKNLAQRINVVMNINNELLEETVVVGYGVTKKRDLAGSVSQIKTDDIKAGLVTSTAQLIKGRAAGVHVRQSSDAPGGSISIRIRGASSISSNNEPLYVIDGVQYDNCDNITPDDIASIEIMKDAASAAIFGSRGANGVVIITTKKGSKGRVDVSYSMSGAVKKIENPWDLMNAEETIACGMKIWQENGESGSAPYSEESIQGCRYRLDQNDDQHGFLSDPCASGQCWNRSDQRFCFNHISG